MSGLSRKRWEGIADGYRHAYHLGGKKEKDEKGPDGVVEKAQETIERRKAAHLILRVLNKLGHEWMRVPLILPGWRDSL